MAIQLIHAAGLYRGVPYAYASVAAVPPGGLVFTAGACPLDADGKVVAVGDIPAQARQAVANLAAALGYPDQLVEIEAIATTAAP